MPLDSRQRILEFLKKSGQASVAELSDALALTAVTIRHHLEGLRAEGLIADPIAKHKPGPGRPEMLYRVTPAADELMPRNYGELCRCLIQAVATTKENELEPVLVEMGSDLGEASGATGKSKAALNYLEERGYFPTVERAEGMIVLRLANCPYLEVARDTQALCEFDRALVGALFGRPVEIQSRIIAHDSNCTFQITS